MKYGYHQRIYQRIRKNIFYKIILTNFQNRTKEDFEYRKNLDKIKRKFAMLNGHYIDVNLCKIKNMKEAISYIINRMEVLQE